MTLTETDPEQLALHLGVPGIEIPASYQPHFNIAPTQEHLVVCMKHETRAVLEARWGLVNRWARDSRNAARCINAMAETIDVRTAYREAFLQRRCAVPCDGFYEWTGPRQARQPLWFHRPYGGLVLLAGLYEAWQRERGVWEFTFTVITTTANSLMRPFHDRMPVLLDPDAVDRWIDPTESDPALLKRLLIPAPDGALVFTAVNPLVNNVNNDGPECLTPALVPFI